MRQGDEPLVESDTTGSAALCCGGEALRVSHVHVSGMFIFSQP